MTTELITLPSMPDRAEILDALFPAGILHSAARSEAKLLAVYLWHYAGCCNVSFPLLLGELQKLGWKDHRTQEKWLATVEAERWITRDALPAPEYDAVRLLTYTPDIWRVAETVTRQRTLFELYPHTPPPMLGRLRRLAQLLPPMPLLLSQTLEPAHKLTAWYYLLAGDWQRMESCIWFAEFERTFNRDPKQCRTTVKELAKQSQGWWEIRDQGKGFVVVGWTRPVYFSSVAIEAQTIIASNPTAARSFLPLLARQELCLGAPVPTVVVVGAPSAQCADAGPGRPVAVGALCAEGAAPTAADAGPVGALCTYGADSGPGERTPTGAVCAQGAESMGADAGHVGALCAQGAESPRCDLGPESLTSAEGLQKTKEAKAKLQLQLAALLDESDSTGAPDSELSARGLRKDLKDLQDEDRKDLQDRGRAQDEDPKDIVTRILRRELELIRALKHAAEGVFNWIFFAIAAMQEGVSIDWPYARGFTFCQQDCIRLNGIIERAIKQPKDPDPKDPKQKCARGYFLGSVARLIAEAIEDDKERAASLAHSKDFWKCDRKCKAVAERISYPWKPCEMFAKYDPRTPAPRFERLSRKGA